MTETGMTFEGTKVYWDFKDHRDSVCYKCEAHCSGVTLCKCCLGNLNFPEIHKAYDLTVQANEEGNWDQSTWLDGTWINNDWNEPDTLCGTTACLAGNYVLSTLSEKEYDKISENFDAFLDLRCEVQDMATTALGLSEYAATALFRANNSLDDIEYTINSWVEQAAKVESEEGASN